MKVPQNHPHTFSQVGWTSESCSSTNEDQTISSSVTSNDNYITFLVSCSLHQLHNDHVREKPCLVHAALKENNVSELKRGNCQIIRADYIITGLHKSAIRVM